RTFGGADFRPAEHCGANERAKLESLRDAFDQDVLHALEHARGIGEFGVGLSESGGLLFQRGARRLWNGAGGVAVSASPEIIGKGSEAGFLSLHAERLALELEGCVKIFEAIEIRGAFDLLL